MTDLEIRQQERIVNAELARLLREECGLNAQAEVILDGRYPDVLIDRRDHGGPVILESEFAPAYSVNDDALAKLGLAYNGQPTAVTFALVLPEDLKQVHQRHLRDRLRSSRFLWSPCYSISGTHLDRRSGGVLDLSTEISQAEPPPDYDDLESAVVKLEKGASAAGARMYSKSGSMARIAQVFDRDASDEVANMAALMVINAMMFHDRLSSATAAVPPPPEK